MNDPLNHYADGGEDILYVFEYLYRDADNFKVLGQLLMSGKITDESIGKLKSYFDYGEYFVAEQVGIPTLYSQLWKYSNGPTLADHAFHEFLSLRPATNKEVLSLNLWGETPHLLETFRLASQQSWDCYLSVHSATF